ncbi:MAG TPA: sporulation protein YunB [Anaerovoracaceae bacterium]|nr:sporulation protein YunB [Anaerovoracaceae bacterium]
MWRKIEIRNRRRKYYILMLLCATLIFYGLFFTGKVIKPAIESIAEMKARSMVAQAVNQVIRDKYNSLGGFEELLDIRMDEVGKVTLVQANSAKMNSISYDLVWEIQEELKDVEEEKILIPLGSIFGNQILSQTGPKVNLKVHPIGASKIFFKTELTEAGINQTKYKIYLDVINIAKVIVPFSDKQIEVKTTLLIAEAVIVGDIPDSYIIVPPDDILDAVNP